MSTFVRGFFTELWITLRSDETLGILDSDYLEDYFGVDGQISLLHDSNVRYTVAMNEVAEETTNIPHDVFTGFLELDSIPNGHYIVQARVRDIANSYTILGAVENPLGTERVINLEFDVVDGPPSNVTVEIGPLSIMGMLSMEMKLVKLDNIQFGLGVKEISYTTKFGVPANIVPAPQADIALTMAIQPEVNLGE
jgi:hypothetical protein